VGGQTPAGWGMGARRAYYYDSIQRSLIMEFTSIQIPKALLDRMTRPPKVGKKIFGIGHLGKQRESLLMVTVVP
jgi:hypothetical protein